jgi:hypothetical protein
VTGTKHHYCLDNGIEELRWMGRILRTAGRRHFYNNVRENLKDKNLLEVLDTEGCVISKLIQGNRASYDSKRLRMESSDGVLC